VKHDFENMTLPEISIATGVPVNTLKSRMFEGMSKTEAATKPRGCTAGIKAFYKPRDLTKQIIPEVPAELLISQQWLRRPIVCAL